MTTEIIFATGNPGKIKEIREIFSGIGVNVRTMREAGFSDDIIEDGKSFEENSEIKARAVREFMDSRVKEKERECVKYIVMADDSGLEIDYLNGEPGVYSSRFAGEDTSYVIKCSMLMDKLAGVPDEKRTARFTTVITAILPDGRVLKVRDTMEGIIAREMAGSGGFGYDPILYLPEYGCTSAELPSGKKNEISHRGKALRAMEKIIRQELVEEH